MDALRQWTPHETVDASCDSRYFRDRWPHETVDALRQWMPHETVDAEAVDMPHVTVYASCDSGRLM